MRVRYFVLVASALQCGGQVAPPNFASPNVELEETTFWCDCEPGGSGAGGTVLIRYTAGEEAVEFHIASVHYVDWSDAGAATNPLAVEFTPMTSGIVVPHEVMAVSHVIRTLPDVGVCAISGGIDLLVQGGGRTWHLEAPSVPNPVCPL